MDWERMLVAINRMPASMEAALQAAVAETARKVRDRAVEKFGTYQPAVGEYPAWPALQEETAKRKLEAGAEGPDPLIGHYKGAEKNRVWPTHLRNSLEVSIGALSAEVGTNDPIGPWQEFGTSRGIPPRPFLYPAAFEEEHDFHKRVLEAAAEGMTKPWG